MFMLPASESPHLTSIVVKTYAYFPIYLEEFVTSLTLFNSFIYINHFLNIHSKLSVSSKFDVGSVVRQRENGRHLTNVLNKLICKVPVIVCSSDCWVLEPYPCYTQSELSLSLHFFQSSGWTLQIVSLYTKPFQLIYLSSDLNWHTTTIY